MLLNAIFAILSVVAMLFATMIFVNVCRDQDRLNIYIGSLYLVTISTAFVFGLLGFLLNFGKLLEAM